MKTLAILLSFFISGPTPSTIKPKIATKALSTSVLLHLKLHTVHGVRHYAGCSGTYVAPTKILTAAHCFEGNEVEYAWARDVNQTVGYPVRLIVKWPAKDLALLDAPYPHQYAKIGHAPRIGDELLNVGSPMSFEFVVSQGIVAALHVKVREFSSQYMLTTAMINPGSSGGGAFNARG